MRHFSCYQYLSADVLVLDTGWAAAPFYDFLKGVSNELARTHLPDSQPRHDTNLGPKGRLADMVMLNSYHGRYELSGAEILLFQLKFTLPG
jgi:hypothetical protein